MQQRIASLQSELTKTEAHRMQLDNRLGLLAQGKDEPVPPQERLRMRQEYVNNDATVKALAEKVAQVEMELLLARQTKADDHSEVRNKVNLLKALKARLAQSKAEVGAAFRDLMAKQAAEALQQNLSQARAELEQDRAYEEHLRKKLAEENAETFRVAQMQQELQQLLDELDAAKATYDEITRRITELKLQPASPAPRVATPPKNAGSSREH
jgi:chromosome segregation ATPase